MKKTERISTAFVEATLIVPTSLVDSITNYITDNISDGVELRETGTSQLVGVTFYVPEMSQTDFRPGLKSYLSQITNSEMPTVPAIKETKVLAQDWEEAYRKSIEPIIIKNELCIRPPWAHRPENIIYDLVIEPKMAFGTGHHETTSACLRLILKYLTKDRRVLDFGCGSGVLAILAAKMGASFVKAVDFDIVAVDNTRENFEINKVGSNYKIIHGSFEQVESDESYDMVCANLTSNDLKKNFEKLAALTKEGGYLVLSGILETEQDLIEQARLKSHLALVELIHINEWLTFALKK